jgi:tyrosine-protein phosphatase YwqE
MARGKRRRGAPKREYEELDVSRLRLSIPHVELKQGIEFQVQQTMGTNAEEGKTWICPMCVVVIEQGVVHTVAWDVHRGVQSRRHFHNKCWKLFDGLLP